MKMTKENVKNMVFDWWDDLCNWVESIVIGGAGRIKLAY